MASQTNKLDKTGLSQVWSKIVELFVVKEDGKGLSTNDYTTADKTKLAGIDEGANKTTVDDALSATSLNPVQNKVVASALNDKIDASKIGAASGVASLDGSGKVPTAQLPTIDAATVNGHSVASDVPENAKFTDTTYTVATTSADGLLSKADKTKLDATLTATEVESKINTAVSGIYKVKGTVAFASLPASGNTVGDVYNVSDAFTTSASFVEGSGKSYPTGTNVVYTDKGWDCMAGVYDFSGYLQKDDLVDITEAEINAICVINA